MLWKDVFVHAKSLRVVVCDVKSLLAKHHPDLWQQWAGKQNQESISCSLLMDDEAQVTSPGDNCSLSGIIWSNRKLRTREKSMLQILLSYSRFPFVDIKGKPEFLCEACLGFPWTRRLVKYSVFIKGGQSPYNVSFEVWPHGQRSI